MKKAQFLLFYLILAAGVVKAQNSATTKTTRPVFSVGPEIGLPVGDFKEFYSSIFAINGKMEFPIKATPVSVTVTGGITNFNVKDKYQPPLDRTYKFVPLKAGGKYFFRPAFYGEAELGAAISTEDTKKTPLIFSVGTGTVIPLFNSTEMDLGLRYEGWQQINDLPQQLMLRAAVRF